jgi:glutathione peroxidase
MTTVHDFHAKTLAGTDVPLSDFRGQVLLIVNTASECGFTPQYEGLQKLYEALHPKGFSALGFPCNQFGGQEPGSEAEIGHFCATHYAVSFPLFAKIEVNGSKAHPLYKFLTSQKRGIFGTGTIKWNFTKFLVDREGKVVARYAPTVKPETLEKPIEKLL